jgi:hypothetical protein
VSFPVMTVAPKIIVRAVLQDILMWIIKNAQYNVLRENILILHCWLVKLVKVHASHANIHPQAVLLVLICMP